MKTAEMKNIFVDCFMIDWLTLTSFEESAYVLHTDLIEASREWITKTHKQVKRMQYLGQSFDMVDGSLFTGYGSQKGKQHSMVQISGQASDRLFNIAKKGILEHWATCTRIDLQMTIEKPDSWSNWRLFNRQKASGRTVGWFESKGSQGQELSTVYVGSRNSQILVRVYIKEADIESDLLRFEVEYKRDKARSLGLAIARNRDVGEMQLKHDVQRLADEKLSLAFEPKFNLGAMNVRSVRRESKTEAWLIKLVLPAFVRVINDHATDNKVKEIFRKAIEESER